MLSPSPLTVITDATGTARSLWGLSLPDRRWFPALVQEASVLLGEADLDLVYRSDPVLAQLVDTALAFCGLRTSWFSPTCLHRLLFEAGEGLPGAIAQLNGLNVEPLPESALALRTAHQATCIPRTSVLSIGTIRSLEHRVCRVSGLSLSDRTHYLNLLSELGADLTLYDNSEWVQGLVEEALLLNGISPYWVDEAMAIALFYPAVPETPSLLMQWNFPAPDEEFEVETESEESDPEAANYASLWSFTESLPQALQLASTEPWSMLQRVMGKRNEQLEAQYDDQGKPLPFKKRQRKANPGNSTPSPWFLELMETGTLNQILEDANK